MSKLVTTINTHYIVFIKPFGNKHHSVTDGIINALFVILRLVAMDYWIYCDQSKRSWDTVLNRLGHFLSFSKRKWFLAVM